MEDVKGIAKIHVNSWAKAYDGLLPQDYIDSFSFEKRAELWGRIIGRELATVFVASDSDNLIGFLCVGQPKDYKNSDTYELSSLYISASHYGGGAGSLLYEACEEMLLNKRAKKVTLWALDKNQRAITFYKKHGFKLTGEVEQERLEHVVLNDLALSKILFPQ